MHYLVIYNPHAAGGRHGIDASEAAAEFISAGAEATLREMDFDSEPLGADEEFDAIVVCGGDGTLNYMLNVIMRAGVTTPIAVIPAGTANDFATMIGMERNPRAAARQILAGEPHAYDCGKVNDRYFINVFSFGIFTTTSQHTPDNAKRKFGRLAYLHEGVKELTSPRAIPLHISCDEGEYDTTAAIVLVFNGVSAGRMTFAPTAQADDGRLDMILITFEGNIIRSLFGALRHLAGHRDTAVRHFRSSRFEISTDCDGIDTDTDGEAAPALPAKVQCIAGGITIIRPQRT